MGNRILLRHNTIGAIVAALTLGCAVASAQPGGVVVTPGDDYGIGVYSTAPGAPGGYTDGTAGRGQPGSSDAGEWNAWSNESGPTVCNPQTCLVPHLPATQHGLVEPLTVAQELVTGMQIRRIDIGIVPEPDVPAGSHVGLIGMPVWLWDKTLPPDSEHTRGPITRTATTGALTVSATAINTAIVWNMGDGGLPVVCPAPAVNNTPYLDIFLDLPPLTGCGRFPPGWVKTSIHEPGGQFTVSATSLWVITWSASGPAGTVGGAFPLLPTATTQVRVGELQVLGAN